MPANTDSAQTPVGFTNTEIMRLVVRQQIERVLDNISNEFYDFMQALDAYTKFGMTYECMALLNVYFSQLKNEDYKKLSKLARQHNHIALRRLYAFFSTEPSPNFTSDHLSSLLFAAAENNQTALVTGIFFKAEKKKLSLSTDDLIDFSLLMIHQNKPSVLNEFLNILRDKDEKLNIAQTFYNASRLNNFSCIDVILKKISKQEAIALIRENQETLGKEIIDKLNARFNIKILDTIRQDQKNDNVSDSTPNLNRRNPSIISIEYSLENSAKTQLSQYRKVLIKDLIKYFESNEKNNKTQSLAELVEKLGLTSSLFTAILKQKNKEALNLFMWGCLPNAKIKAEDYKKTDPKGLFNALDKSLQSLLLSQASLVADLEGLPLKQFLDHFQPGAAAKNQFNHDAGKTNKDKKIKITSSDMRHVIDSHTANKKNHDINIEQQITKKTNRAELALKIVDTGLITAGTLMLLSILPLAVLISDAIKNFNYKYVFSALTAVSLCVFAAIASVTIGSIAAVHVCMYALIKRMKSHEEYEINSHDRDKIEKIINAFTPHYLGKNPNATSEELIKQLEIICDLKRRNEELSPNASDLWSRQPIQLTHHLDIEKQPEKPTNERTPLMSQYNK